MGKGRDRGGDAKLLERALLELAHPLDAQIETAGDFSERLGAATEAVVRVHDLALTLVQCLREAGQLLYLHALNDLFVLILCTGVGQQVLEGGDGSLLAADRLREPAGRALDRDQALYLLVREASRRRVPGARTCRTRPLRAAP